MPSRKKTCIDFWALKMIKKNAKHTRATKKRILDSMIDSKSRWSFFQKIKTKSLIWSQKHYTREKKTSMIDVKCIAAEGQLVIKRVKYDVPSKYKHIPLNYGIKKSASNWYCYINIHSMNLIQATLNWVRYINTEWFTI